MNLAKKFCEFPPCVSTFNFVFIFLFHSIVIFSNSRLQKKSTAFLFSIDFKEMETTSSVSEKADNIICLCLAEKHSEA
jgi:hypothetical protein